MAPAHGLAVSFSPKAILFGSALLAAVLFAAGGKVLTGRTANGFEIVAYTVDGGGGFSSGGGYTLYSVAGQPDAGKLTSGSYTLYGGLLHPAVAPAPPSGCPGPIGNIVTGASGAFAEIWCGVSVNRVDLTTYLGGGATPVSAIFLWSNGDQQFKFWFRGFPDTFQTLPVTGALSAGNNYFFQTTAQATIPTGAAGTYNEITQINAAGGGAHAYIWTGGPHLLADLEAFLPATFSAIFQWSNQDQQFKFWFRGFPVGFQTLGAAGILSNVYYFFQTTGAVNNYPMN